MAANPIETHVRLLDEIAVVQVKGELDALSEGPLVAAYTKVENWKPTAVLLDLGEVGYINSTGIALIVALLGRARKSQIRLMICGLSQYYREVFRITRLANYIELYPDENEALAHASARP